MSRNKGRWKTRNGGTVKDYSANMKNRNKKPVLPNPRITPTSLHPRNKQSPSVILTDRSYSTSKTGQRSWKELSKTNRLTFRSTTLMPNVPISLH